VTEIFLACRDFVAVMTAGKVSGIGAVMTVAMHLSVALAL